ncbi:LpqB family beta-propeller domain-containing protein [Cellulomonas taurus]|uniref:LpqB family beta-propeller domain-containing protein n=1 Tax=Cellulomonas taurus TaxID=2729175 RepID=UPI00145CFEE2|nr:LpqB family beta-propeller domain-containing protein [Cellulomonas taurus]
MTRRIALLLVVLFALVGCAAMPTSGPVGVGVDQDTEQESVELLGDPPPQDGSPEDIVRGFLGASAAGFSRRSDTESDDFRNAREYLSGETRRTWTPRERVVVYPTASSPKLRLDGSEVQVTVKVAARIDADGRYSQAGPSAEETLSFGMVQDSEGQWRIAALDDGVVLSEPNFEAIYRSSTLYFLSQDETFLVPETRWFPLRNLATSIVRALIAGPSPWLRDAVRTAIPEGATLQPDAVSVDADGVAAISLAAGGLPAEPHDRSLMQAQLEASLRLARVRTVEVSADGVAMEPDPVTLDRGQDPGGALEAVQGGATLVQLSHGEFVPVDGVDSVSGLDLRSPARQPGGPLRVGLSGSAKLITLPTDAQRSTTLLATESALVPPSVDRLGWVWTAVADSSQLIAVNDAGSTIRIDADWLVDREVRAVRIARDASRIAVISDGADGVRIDVTAVVRDDSGTPQSVGPAQRVGATLVDASRVVWVDESSLGVLGISSSVVTEVYHLVPLAGASEPRGAIADPVDIAGGKGDSVVYLSNSEDQIYSRSGPSWVAVADDVRYPSFAG